MTPLRKTEEVAVGTVKAGNQCLWFTQSINSSDVDICDALFSSFLRFLHCISRILDLDQHYILHLLHFNLQRMSGKESPSDNVGGFLPLQLFAFTLTRIMTLLVQVKHK